MNTVKQYLSDTKTLLYSFLFSLPLFLIYEGLIIISQPSAEQIVRISVDVWIKTIFTSLGVNAVSFSLLVVLLAGIIILYKERERLRTLNFKYFPALLVESAIYGVIVAFISSTLTTALLNMSATNPIDHLFTKAGSVVRSRTL